MRLLDIEKRFGKEAEIGIESVFYGMEVEIYPKYSFPHKRWTLFVRHDDGRLVCFNLYSGENFRFMPPRAKMLAFHKISRAMLLGLVKLGERREAYSR